MNRKILYVALLALTACTGIVNDERQPNELSVSWYETQMMARTKNYDSSATILHKNKQKTARMMEWIVLSKN